MYCFVMKLSMSTAKEIEKDLRVGSLAKHVKVTRLDQAFRMSYDFLSIYYSLHALSGYQSSGYLAMTDFKNPFFFKFKHSNAIQFSLQIPSVDFITDEQAALVFQIQKRIRYSSIHKKTRMEELSDLIGQLDESIQPYKII